MTKPVQIPDAAVQAALEYYSEGGCMGLDSYERKEVATAMLEAALPYLRSGLPTSPVDVAAVREAEAVIERIAKDFINEGSRDYPQETCAALKNIGLELLDAVSALSAAPTTEA